MDKCVLCGVETPYDRTTEIAERKFYIEGSGQLCEPCFKKTYGDNAFSNPGSLLTPISFSCPICTGPADPGLNLATTRLWHCQLCGNVFET